MPTWLSILVGIFLGFVIFALIAAYLWWLAVKDLDM